jgi:hypothetical protein
VKTVIKKVFEILGVAPDSRLPDQTDLDAVQLAARQMSVNQNYRDVVIVVVELGSEFCVDTGSYVRRQYLHYPFREAADYRRIVCLKAAYCNGKRMDTSQDVDTASSKPTLESRFSRPPGAALVWGKPGRWTVRSQDEQSFARN